MIDEAWAEESESRLDAFESGKLPAHSFDDVINEMNTDPRTGRADN